MAEFPSHPDGVTPAWLSERLGRRIDTVAWQPIGTGQVGDSVRFTISGEGGEATLAGKFSAADATSRATAAMFGLYAKEVAFYREVAAGLTVRNPRVYFAEIDSAGEDFILLFEDLGPARQGDQIANCSLDDAREAIRQAAALHASSWGRAEILEAEWLQPPADLGQRVGAMYPQAQAVWRERYAERLEPEFMALCEEFAEASALWFGRDAPRTCLVHGDFRLDNMLFDIAGGAEPIAVLDWQTVALGHGMTDVGYFLGCGIGELGLRHEDELLALYLAQMEAGGVALTREDVERDYRLGILHGLSTAVFSAAFVKRTPRGDENFLSMVRGACALALQNDSLACLKETA